MKIFTHNGRAHIDEFLACSILASKFKIDEIIRTNRIETCNISEEDFVVDIGLKYDGKKYFDHHQNDERVNGKCAATLVAEQFAPELLNHSEWGKFFQRIDFQDNYGISKISKEFLLKRETVPYFLLLESEIVKLFKREPLKTANLFGKIFKNVIDEIEIDKKIYKWIIENTKIKKITNLRVLIYKTNPHKYSINGDDLIRNQKKIIDESRIDIIYGYDMRSNKKFLFRTHLSEHKVDFRKIKSGSIAFNHKGGFLIIFSDHYRDYIKFIKQSA